MRERVKVLLLALSAALTVGLVPIAGAWTASNENVVPGRILVKFRPEKAEAARSQLQAEGLREAKDKRPLERLGVRIFEVPPGRERELAVSLARRSDVEFAEPDFLATVQFIPNDPLFSQQWNLTKVGAPKAWDQSTGTGINVAVIDTGIDETHPDLMSQILTATTVLSSPHDGNGHGTHVAGIIAAQANNGIGVAGLAFGARILSIKALDDNGSGTYSDVASAIVLATDLGAKIINLSLGGPNPSQTLSDAVNYALAHDVLVVAASGNSGANSLLYPAAIPGVLAVGSTNSSDTRSTFSNYGSGLGITAPGEGIVSTLPCPSSSEDPTCSSGYGTKTGTSMATPMASGLAALVWSVRPGLTAAQVKDILQRTAVDLGSLGWDPQYGYGRISVDEAVRSVSCLTEPAHFLFGPIDASAAPMILRWAGVPTVTVALYNYDGTSAGNVALSGSGVQSTASWPAGFQGYAELTSGACSNPVLLTVTSAWPQFLLPSVSSTEAGIPLRIGSGYSGGLFLINPTAASTVVDLTIFNTFGDLVHNLSVPLSARGARTLTLEDLGLIQPGWVWVSVTSTTPIATYGFWQRTLGLPTYFPATSPASELQLAAVRRGVDGWLSQLWLLNPQSQPTEVTVEFRGNGRIYRTLTTTLPPHGFAIADAGRARLPVGWEGTARITADRPIYAMNVLQKSSRRQVGFLGPVEAQRAFHLPATLKNWFQWYTALRVYNVSSSKMAVSFQTVLPDGHVVLDKFFSPVGPLRVQRYVVSSSSALGNPFAGGIHIYSGLTALAVAELTWNGRTYFVPLR